MHKREIVNPKAEAKWVEKLTNSPPGLNTSVAGLEFAFAGNSRTVFRNIGDRWMNIYRVSKLKLVPKRL